jgi:hypothetical protein
LTESGNAFIWGQYVSNSPKLIEINVIIVQICGSYYHSFLLTSNGDIFIHDGILKKLKSVDIDGRRMKFQDIAALYNFQILVG